MAKKLTKIVFLASLLFTVSTLLMPIFVNAEVLQGGDPFADNERESVNKQVFMEPHPINGAYMHEYKLTLPPGRNDLTPEISITYSSQNSSNISPFGYGWDINIPSIERIPRKGINHLYDETTNYFFSSFDGEVIASSTEPNTEDYGPLVQSDDFRKYEFVDNTWWRVTDKKGVVYKFGQATSTRQTNHGNDYEVFKWMIEEVRDQNDNYISYSYYKDNGQIYPSIITYTGNNSTDGIFDVEFTRESRNDLATSTLAGFPIVSNYRISEIQAEINDSWVRKYELDYTTGDNGVRSMLDTITETGRDDDLNTLSLPITDFDYTAQLTTASTTWTEDSNYSIGPTFVDSGTNDMGTRLADVNGDGLVDMIRGFTQCCGLPQINQVFINDGDGTGWTLDTNYSIPTSFTDDSGDDYGARVVDVNADGFVDVIRFWSNGSGSNLKKIWINDKDGTGWTEDTNYSTSTIPAFAVNGYGRGIRIFDVNSDGLPDLVQSWQDSSGPAVKKIWINDGDGTGWTEDTSYGTSTIPLFSYVNDDHGVRVVDVDGNGSPDFIRSYDDGYGNVIKKVYVNRLDDKSWVEDTNYSTSTIPTFVYQNYDTGVRIFDANGDGLQDVVISHNTTRKVYINDGDGTGWTLDPNYSIPGAFTDNSSYADLGFRAVDVNGDNVVDFIRSYAGSPDIKKVWIGNAVDSDLLSQITTSVGSVISVNYKTSASTDGNKSLPLNLTVVDTVTENDGFGNIATTTYTYQGGEYYYNNEFDRKFAGFATTTITDAVGNITKNFFHQGNGSQTSIGEYGDDICKAGKIYRTEIYDDSSNLFKKIINKWENFVLSNNRDFVKNTRTVTYDYDGNGDHKDIATEKTYDDSIGNITQIVNFGEVTGSDDGTFSDVTGDTSTTTISYAINSSDYIYSLPKIKLVTDFDGSTSTEDRFYYDSQSLGAVTIGNLTKQESWISDSNYIDTEWIYDGTYGLITQRKDPRNKTTNYTHDGYNLFVATETNPLSQVTQYTYDYSSGKVKQTTDPNSRVFQTIYDALDREKTIKVSDIDSPASLVTKTAFTYTDTVGSRKILETNYLNSSTSTDKYTYLDGLDRKIQERIETENPDIFSVTDYQYDKRGLLNKQSLPYQNSGSSKTSITTNSDLLTTFTYDTLKRISTIVNSKGTESYSYDQWETVIVDRENNQKDFTKDAYGNLVQVDEHNGSTYATTYEYDVNKNLTKITDALDNVRNFTYDGLSRMTKSEDLHDSVDTTVGSTTLAYDDSGNITSKQIPDLDTISFTYDDINRVLTEDSGGSAGTEIAYSYDWCDEGEGRLCSATTTDAVTKYEYNAVGNIAKEIKEIGVSIFETLFSYDRQGNKTQIVYPDGSDVVYLYNTAGSLEKVLYSEVGTSTYTTIIDNFDYHSSGQKSSIGFGNDIQTDYTYATTSDYRIEKIETQATTTSMIESGDKFSLVTNVFKKIGSFVSKVVLGTEIAYAEELNDQEFWQEGLKVGEDYNLSGSQLKKFIKKGWNYVSKPVVVDVTEDGKKVRPTQYETEFHSKWINYKTDTSWEPINTNFVQTENGFEMTNAPFEVYLPENSTGTAVMRDNGKWDIHGDKFIDEESLNMSIQALNINEVSGRIEKGDLTVPTGIKENINYVIYEGSYPNGDLIYYVDFGEIPRLEKLIRFNSKPTKLEYSFNLLYSGDVDFEKVKTKEKWNKEDKIEIKDDSLKVTRKDSEVRGFGFSDFLLWDSGFNYVIDNEIEESNESENMEYINVSVKKDKDDLYILTKKLPGSFFEKELMYPVYTDVAFYPASGANSPVDGTIINYQSASWSTVHNASSGSNAYPSSSDRYIKVYSNGPTQWAIERGFFLFNTASIPDADIVTSATFAIDVTSKQNDDNDGDDFLVVVQSSPNANNNLVTGDYDQCGTISNPTEGSERIDIDDIVSGQTTTYNYFSLDETGLGWIDTQGITKLGLREGHDVLNSSLPNYYTNYIGFRLAEWNGTANDPKLTVTHTVANYAPISPTDLQTENALNPTALTDSNPEFSAIYNDPDDGDNADNYQIQVSTSTDFTIIYWDSGKTSLSTTTSEGSRSEEISYGGSSLASSTSYYWRIKFWDIYGDEGSYSTTTASFTLNSAPTEPTDMLTEGNTNPVDVGDTSPEFSAIYNDPDSSSYAKYYQIQVATSSDYWSNPYWDSTKTLLTSSTTPENRIEDISYSGSTPEVGSTYYWRIKLWDNGDFEGAWSTATTSFSTINPGLQSLFYEYDNVGNIATTTDISDVGVAKIVRFVYDSLYRLTSASTTEAYSNPFNRTYTYNAIGNLTNKSDQGDYTYSETGYANPQAVTSIDGVSCTYDNKGNMTAYGSDTYTWDYRNRLTESTVSSNTDYYTYDHENIRVEKGNGTATTTYPNMYYSVTSATTTKHIYNPVTGELLATIEGNGVATTTNYIHLDHLGSTNVVTDENGEVAQALDYYPFGELRIDDTTNFDETKKFTSHELDRSSDLTYAKQRYYDQDVGKFLSQDPVFLNMGVDSRTESALKDPQSLNSYSYSKNNPVNLIDPDGEWVEIGLSAILPFRSFGISVRFDKNGADLVLGGGVGAGFEGGADFQWTPGVELTHEKQGSVSVESVLAKGVGLKVSKDVATVRDGQSTKNENTTVSFVLGGGTGVAVQEQFTKPLFMWNSQETKTGNNMSCNPTHVSDNYKQSNSGNINKDNK